MFVDGCFWHRCPSHFTAPRANAAWWEEKIEANVERDRRQTTQLAKFGWTVVRIWEHEVLQNSVEATTDSLVARLRAMRAQVGE